MNDFTIPVRAVGAGSQPVQDDALDCLGVPQLARAFRMPEVPARAQASALPVAREVLASFLHQFEQWKPAATGAGPRLDLATVPADALELVNQMLGEGEVSVRVAGAPEYRIQESVFTGLWRVCAFDGDGRHCGDWLEAGGLPGVVPAAARSEALQRVPVVEVPTGAMNAPALLAEIDAQMRARRPGARAHVINLTLLPVTREDHAMLASALDAGPVAIVSRGFGNCRIESTRARDVWRVRYFNSVSTLILDTIEVVDVPEAALAATEDLEDSRGRLAELVDWMAEPASD
jgi:hydrogenase-1 operon protein HyaF